MSFSNLFLFILQIIVAILLIVIILFQSSDEDSLGGIGASAGKSGLLSHKASTSLITKITIILGVIFMFNSFLLTSISTHKYIKNKNIMKDYFEQNKEELDKKELNKEEIKAIDNKNSNIENNVNNNIKK